MQEKPGSHGRAALMIDYPLGQAMNEQRDKPFIVKSDRAFGALRHWLKERGCNTYSHSDRRHIQVGYDSKPDSDWGKYTNRGYIVVCDPELFERTRAEIENAFRKNRAFGWAESA